MALNILIIFFCGTLLRESRGDFELYADCFRSIRDKYFNLSWILIFSALDDNEKPRKTRNLLIHDLDYATMYTQLFQENHLTELANVNYREHLDSEDIPRDRAHQVVILLTVKEPINETVQGLVGRWKSHEQWFGGAKILIVVIESEYTHVINTTQIIMDEMWKETGAINVIVTVLVENRLEFYTWFPYTGNCQVEAILQDECNAKGLFKHERSLYPEKIIKNLNQCPFTISFAPADPFVFFTLSQGGIEVKLINNLARIMNLKIVVVNFPMRNLPWREIGTHNEPAGLLAWVYARKIDATFFGSYLNLYKHLIVDYLHSYFEDEDVWVVPQPALLPKWTNVFRPFDHNLWITLIVLTIIAAFALHIITRIERLDFWLILIFGLNLNQPAILPFNYTTFRVFIACYLILFININTAYQSSIINLLTGLNYEKPLKSPVDAYNKGMYLNLFPTQNLTIDQSLSSKDAMRVVLKRVNQTGNVYTQLKDAIILRNQYFLFSRAKITYTIRQKYTTITGHPLLRFLPQRFSYQNPIISMKRDHPLTGIMQKKVFRFREGGFVTHWLHTLMIEVSLKIRNTSEVLHLTEENEVDALTIEELSGAFIVLSTGTVVCVVALMAELIIYRYSSKGSLK